MLGHDREADCEVPGSGWSDSCSICWSQWAAASDGIGGSCMCVVCCRTATRKSIEPMAARLPDGNVQAMQQFVGQSPWEWEEVWARLGKRMTAELGTGFGLGCGRHRVSQTRRGFRGCRAAVFLEGLAPSRDVGDARPLLPD